MSDLYNNMYNPDVLTCLANLSNDEVFTPPDVANDMLDLLPQELFESPDTTFLDPACKSGVFLREITKRLDKGLEKKIPNKQVRIDHILHKQVYGIAITELTSLMSRRSLYCSKYANSVFSISKFENVEGNIRYRRCNHKWKNDKCVYCGAPREAFDRGENYEEHAYETIHTNEIRESLNHMKFDVVISNPPYQLNDNGNGASAKPIYHLFIEQALKLNPRYMSMVIPARWYAGGKGLDVFRDEMLNNRHIKELHDFPITSDCFPGVNIRGGVCYFVYDREYDTKVSDSIVVTHKGSEVSRCIRPLKYKDIDIFIRYNQAISILKKVMNYGNDTMMDSIVSSRKPFGLSGDYSESHNYHLKDSGLINPVICFSKNRTKGYVENSEIHVHREWIKRYKVFVPRANNIGTELNDDNLNSFVGIPNTICTESYIVIGADLDLNAEKSEMLATYLQTRFARFLHSLAKSSQDATARTYRFIPVCDFNDEVTDKRLFEKYSLTKDEIAFIESTINEMN